MQLRVVTGKKEDNKRGQWGDNEKTAGRRWKDETNKEKKVKKGGRYIAASQNDAPAYPCFLK